MTHKAKLALGIAALAPFMVMAIGLLFAVLLTIYPKLPAHPGYLPFTYLFGALWIVSIVSSIAASFICTSHCKRVGQWQRHPFWWAFRFNFLWLFFTPIYWYKYIWNYHENMTNDH